MLDLIDDESQLEAHGVKDVGHGRQGGVRLPLHLDELINGESIGKEKWTSLAKTLYAKTRIIEGQYATGDVFASVATHHAESVPALWEWNYQKGSVLRRRVWHRLHLSTRLDKLNVERRKLEAVVKAKSALVDGLGPASHEQGLLLCEVLHKRYNEMRRQLVDFKAEFASAKKERWKLVQENHDSSREKHAAISHLQQQLHAAREHLRHIQRDNRLLELRARQHFHMTKGAGARLFGPSIRKGVESPYDTVEEVAGTGGAPNNSRLEANELQDQLNRLDADISQMKQKYVKLQGERRAKQRKLINNLIRRSHDLYRRLKSIDAKRLPKKQGDSGPSKLASFLFGGNA